jgi:hypothetical protein
VKSKLPLQDARLVTMNKPDHDDPEPRIKDLDEYKIDI